MKILLTTHGYSTKKNPTRQVFVKKIYEGLKECLPETDRVDVLFNKYFYFFSEKQGEGNIFTRSAKITFWLLSYIPYILYKAKNYDIIYSHGALYSASLMSIGAKLYRKKLICYVHGGDVNKYSNTNGVFYKFIKSTLMKCDLVVTNSYYMQGRLKIEYDIDSIVISPGYNDKVFKYIPTKKKIDILFAGNAIKRKGIDILLKAIQLNKGYYRENKIKVRIHCSGVLKDDYIKFVEKFNLNNIISFGSRLEENELANAYRKTKLFIFPSREEPLGLVGIEAIACGAYLIATDTGGITEYVTEDYNGKLFNNGNYEELHQCIVSALNDYEKIKSNLPVTSQSVKKFSMTDSLKNTIKVFDRLLHEN
jgi:L-malate glycosyltransferase